MPDLPRALVVDDSRPVRLVIRALLEPLGFAVEEAADGRAALDRLGRGGPPALLLLDRRMPGLDGLDLLRRIRADPALVALPILMVTSSAAGAEVEEALAAGASEYLMKPFDRATLESKLTLLGFDPPSSPAAL